MLIFSLLGMSGVLNSFQCLSSLLLRPMSFFDTWNSLPLRENLLFTFLSIIPVTSRTLHSKLPTYLKKVSYQSDEKLKQSFQVMKK